MLRPTTWKLLSVGRSVSTWTPLATAFNAKNSSMFESLSFKRKEADDKKLMHNIRKQERLNNVVITGRTFISDDKDNFKSNVERWIIDNLKVQPAIEDVVKFGTGPFEYIVIKCKSWDDKQLILNSKNKLTGTKIWIDHDFTKEEREVQRIIKFVAKKLKENGKIVKVAYKKLYVNNELWTYNQIKRHYENELGISIGKVEIGMKENDEK